MQLGGPIHNALGPLETAASRMQVTQALRSPKHFKIKIDLSARTAWLYSSQALPDDAVWLRLMQPNKRFLFFCCQTVQTFFARGGLWQ